MEDGENATVSIGSIGDVQSHWWWALSTAAQLTWAISASRRDCHYRLVPYKALGVATLFVSAGASAAISTLHACGIRTVKDIQELSQKTKGIITVRQTVNASPNLSQCNFTNFSMSELGSIDQDNFKRTM